MRSADTCGATVSTKTKIEWTEATWNPIRGCSRVSEGCRNCYAERQAIRQAGEGGAYEGLVTITNGHPQWTGKIRFSFKKLVEPLHWRKPRRIFVNSMSDLFHEGVEDHEISCVFSVMEAAQRHTFQVLTKRPERMKSWVEKFDKWLRYAGETTFAQRHPNVWLGVSVENQATAEERIPTLLRTPAAVRWISAEPLLGPVYLNNLHPPNYGSAFTHTFGWPSVDWVVVGGESGPGARPMSLRWARSVVEDCQAYSVPVFVKQLGAKPGTPSCADFDCTHPDCGVEWLKLKDRKGGDPSEWPEDLRVREYPKETYGE